MLWLVTDLAERQSEKDQSLDKVVVCQSRSPGFHRCYGWKHCFCVCASLNFIEEWLSVFSASCFRAY